MAGTINTSSFPKALWPGVKSWWGTSYSEHEVEYTELFDKETSDKKYEERTQIVGLGLAPVKSEGSPVAYDTMQQGYVQRLTNIAYALGFIVTHEEIEDNLYMEVAKARTEQLAFSMRQTKEILGASVYNNAFSGSYTGADGVSLLSTSHPTVSGNQSNTFTVAAQLSEAALESMYINIGKAVNDRGFKIKLLPESLVIPVALYPTACRILESTLQNDSANNAINFLKASKAFPKGVIVNHYLTADHVWFIRTNAPQGLIYQEREKIAVTQDNDFDTENAKYKAYERYAFGWVDWRSLFGSNAP
jgi:hypothetical protein